MYGMNVRLYRFGMGGRARMLSAGMLPKSNGEEENCIIFFLSFCRFLCHTQHGVAVAFFCC